MSVKRHMTEGIEQPNQEILRTLGGMETYKYLGILETDIIKHLEMKEKMNKEYLKRTRKLIEIKLHSRNLIKGIYTWAVLLVRYSELFLKWTRGEPQQIDQRTRKFMTIHLALHPRDDVDRLYLPRKEGGRGLTSIQDSVDVLIRWLEDVIKKSWGRLIAATRYNTDNTRISRIKITRKQKWEEKQLYGDFKQQISKISQLKIWT